MKKFPIILLPLLLLACSSESTENSISTNHHDIGTSHNAIINPIYYSYGFYSKALTGVAAVYVADHPDYPDQAFCSGVLISPHHVLTAAHCIANLSGRFALIPEDETSTDCQWTAKFVSTGTNDFFNHIKIGFGENTSQTKKQLFDVKSVTYHTGYAHVAEAKACLKSGYDGYEYTENDIAIIELTSEVPKTIATPIPPLPPWLAITTDEIMHTPHGFNLDTGVEAIVAGYGYDQQGIKGYLDWTSIILRSYCENTPDHSSYCTYDKTLHIKGCHPTQKNCTPNVEVNYDENRLAFPKGSFFYPQKSSGPCNGDSGGPAVIRRGNRLYVAGITSYGDKICASYGVSTAVQDYYEWIQTIVPEIKLYYTEDCHNNLDDDNNGLVDHDDPECANEYWCGDGIVQAGELCDGNVFYDDIDSCYEWNAIYESGKVTCTPDCKISYENCVEFPKPDTCGNGVIDADEQCDGDLFNSLYGEAMESNLCSEYSAFFGNGTIKCTSSCRVETEHCSYYEETDTCYNNVLDPGEICDGQLFSTSITPSHSCRDYDGHYSDGKLSCVQCKLDFSQCIASNICGDGIVSGNEPCDSDKYMFDEVSCKEWSSRFESGTVTCNDNCSINYNTCTPNKEFASLCGNGNLDKIKVHATVVQEECDGSLFLNGKECSDWDSRYIAGKVSCDANCTINYKNCILHHDNIDDENYNLSRVLSRELKPNYVVPQKSKDYVTFYQGNANQKESLDFKKISNTQTPDNPTNPDNPTTPDNPTNPDDPPNPDNPTNPDVPENDPSNKSNDGGCTSSPMSPSAPFSLPILFMMAASLFRKKKRHFLTNMAKQKTFR